MARPLTAAAVHKAQPTAARRVIRDGGARSLYLVIQPSGHKSWLMRFRRPGGKPGKIVLGPVDSSGREVSGDPVIGMPLTLAGARHLAAQVHRDRAMGGDPVADHKTRVQRQRVAIVERAAGTFGACVRQFIDEHGRERTRKWRYTAKQLGLEYPKSGGDPVATKNGLAQRWADRPVRDIDGHDVYAAVEEARRVGTPGIRARKRGISEARARELHSALSSMFSWLHRRRGVEVNPPTNVFRPPPSMPRDRVLSNEEIRLFWQACDAVSEPFGAVFRLLLLTGARLNEVAGMRWDELSEAGAWSLPGARTKNKRAHQLSLPTMARDIIAGVRRIEACPFVFSTTGTTPISGWSKIKKCLDAEMGDPPAWVLHDLRRTAATGMAGLGIRIEVIEQVLNHRSGTFRGIVSVYQHHDYVEERRDALERWSRHVQGIVTDRPAAVVSMPRRRV